MWSRAPVYWPAGQSGTNRSRPRAIPHGTGSPSILCAEIAMVSAPARKSHLAPVKGATSPLRAASTWTWTGPAAEAAARSPATSSTAPVMVVPSVATTTAPPGSRAASRRSAAGSMAS